MTTTVSKVFDFFEQRSPCTIERYEIASAAFSDLRFSLRSIIVGLYESDDVESKEIADQLRSVLSEWLTVPVKFDDTAVIALKDMGTSTAIESRWGSDIRGHYENAIRAAQDLIHIENPVRTSLAKVIRDLHRDKRSYRIFCHRRAREHFLSLFESSGINLLSDDIFLHSVVQYREAEPFDALLKVGPLRLRGWGATPDAVLTAPRFHTLIQTIWSGCGDDPGFGYDPLSEVFLEEDGVSNQYIQWDIEIHTSCDDTIRRNGIDPDINDLEVFSRFALPSDMQSAILVEVDDAHGIFYPPHSQVLSMDGSPDAIDYRLPEELLSSGMFLLLPVLRDDNLDELQAEEGRFSRMWKKKLSERFTNDPEELANKLFDAGLELLGLHHRIKHWCSPATTVIPAPQRVSHFKILIQELGMDVEPNDNNRTAWWEYAWDEIRRSRGEAILTGVQEHRNLEEQVITVLHSLHSEIRTNMGMESFDIPIPQGQPVQGVLRFFKINAIEGGYQVPRAELRMLCELSTVGQWLA